MCYYFDILFFSIAFPLNNLLSPDFELPLFLLFYFPSLLFPIIEFHGQILPRLKPDNLRILNENQKLVVRSKLEKVDKDFSWKISIQEFFPIRCSTNLRHTSNYFVYCFRCSFSIERSCTHAVLFFLHLINRHNGKAWPSNGHNIVGVTLRGLIVRGRLKIIELYEQREGGSVTRAIIFALIGPVRLACPNTRSAKRPVKA